MSNIDILIKAAEAIDRYGKSGWRSKEIDNFIDCILKAPVDTFDADEIAALTLVLFKLGDLLKRDMNEIIQ